jgi:hypothetical protein
MEYWRIGEQVSEARLPLLQHSITPLLHSAFTPLFQFSFIPFSPK